MQKEMDLDFNQPTKFKEGENSSDESLEKQNETNLSQIKSISLNQKLTSYQKLYQYFHLFLQPFNLLDKNQISQLENRSKDQTKLLPQALARFFESIQTFSQFQCIQSLKQELKPDEKIANFVRQYQTQNRQTIEDLLLKSKRFRKTQTFTQNLIINEFYPSKHYEVVKLEIQLLWYKTQIIILNELSKSPLKNFSEISGSGSFGYVYFVNILDQELAIKSIPIQKESFNEEIEQTLIFFRRIVVNAIKEYFFVLLCSQLEIGPKVKKISGFDMIIFEDCVHFASQICLEFNAKSSDFTPLYESLFKMHMLQIIHRDIKPTNIMFSECLDKYVFIDFGCSEILNETVGYKTFTKFSGTTAFCTQQLLRLLTKFNGTADLYYNDFFALKKSIQFDEPSQKSEEFEEKVYIQSYQFEIYAMKYLLYTEVYEQFSLVWKLANINWCDQIQEIQIKLLKFYPELKPNQFLKKFFWSEISEGSRQKSEFKSLISIFKNETCETLTYFCRQFIKQNQYDFYESFYKSLPTFHGNFAEEQRQIELVLREKSTLIEKIIVKDFKYNPKENFIQSNQNIKFFLYIAKYSQIGLSEYQINIEEKIKACEKALSLIKQIDFQFFQEMQIVFDCPIEKFQPINEFYHYFLIKIWRKLPQKYREQSISEIVSTLCFLGFPIHSQTSIAFVSMHFINDNSEIGNLKIVHEDRLEKITSYWEARLSFLIFQNIFYNRAHTKSKLLESEKFQDKTRKTIEKLMKASENQSNKFMDINNKFFKCLMIQHIKFDEKTFIQIYDILNGPLWKKPEFSSYKIKKWRYLMHIFLCYISFVYRIKDAWKVYQSIEEVMFFAFKYNKSILPYLISFFYSEVLRTYKNSHIIFEKIDQKVNCRELSLRFEIQFRFIISLEKDEVMNVHEITDILIKQISSKALEVDNMQLLQKILECIYCYMLNRLKDKNFMTKIEATLILRCLDVFKISLQIGLNYDGWKKKIIYFFINDNTQSISIVPLESCLRRSIFIRCFFVHLVKIGEIFQRIKTHLQSHPFLKNIEFQLCGLNKKTTFEKIILEEKYLLFLQDLPKCDSIFNFVTPWLQAMKENKQMKKIIKQSRTLCLQFIATLINQRKIFNPDIKTDEIINELFGTVTAQSFDTQSQPSNLPNQEVAFDYFFLKVNMTNYDRYWCEEIITLYRILIKKGIFDKIVYKEGLIRTIFYCFIKTERSYQEIEDLLQNYTLSIKQNAIIPVVKSVEMHLNKFFWCKCQKCIELKTGKWDLNNFVETLYKKVFVSNFNHNHYMSLTYLYCMTYRTLKTQVYRKFTVFIVKSINKVIPYARDLMKQRIYYFVYKVNHSFFLDVFHCKSWTREDLEKYKIAKEEINSRKFRRFVYFFMHFKKNEPQNYYQIEDHIEKRFFRQYLIEGYRYPFEIKELYKRKLRRYYYIKENNIMNEVDIEQKEIEALEKM